MTIETKKVASVNEAISIINRLNYTNETFHYNNSTYSNDYRVEYRFCDGVRDNDLYSGMSIIEIVVDGTLQTVRFFNHFCDIAVDLRIGDFMPDYDRFDNVIDADAVDTENANVENLTPNQKLAAQIVATETPQPTKFEVGQVYRLNYYNCKDVFKVIRRGAAFLTISVFLDNTKEFSKYPNRYKIRFNDDEGEYIEGLGLLGIYRLYATNLVTDFAPAADVINTEAQDAETEIANNSADETVNAESAPADDFESKLAELKADVDAARIDYDAKIAERVKLQAAVEDAKNAEYIAYDNLCVATRKFDRLGNAKARELRDSLITSDILATRDLIIYNQKGRDYLPVLKFLGVWFIDGKFEIRCDKEASNIIYTLAEYDTPAQVTAAINQLKDAIERGGKQFKFPTIDELNTQNAMGIFKKIYRFGRLRHVIASNGQHMWYSFSQRIGSKARDIILKEYGITVDAFLAAEKQFQIEEDARLDAALKAHDQAKSPWDKIQRESKPLDQTS